MTSYRSSKRKSRSRSSSAFFILLKAALKALSIIVLTLFLEIWFNELFPVWKESLSYGMLWLIPLLFGTSEFLETLFQRSWISTFVWAGACFCLVLIVLLIHLSPPAQLTQIGMMRNHVYQKASQNRVPSIEHTLREPLCEVPLYFEDLNGGIPVLPFEDQAQIARMINALPEVLKNRAAGVYFLSPASFDRLHHSDTPDEVAGFTQMGTATIVIKVRMEDADRYQALRKDGLAVALDDPFCYQETIVHEFCHLLDVRWSGQTACLSERRDWLDLYERYQPALGEYASTNPAEFFAEAGVFYFLYSDFLEWQYPEIAQWFSDHAFNPSTLRRPGIHSFFSGITPAVASDLPPSRIQNSAS